MSRKTCAQGPALCVKSAGKWGFGSGGALWNHTSGELVTAAPAEPVVVGHPGRRGPELRSLDCLKGRSWVWLDCVQAKSCWSPRKRVHNGPSPPGPSTFQDIIGSSLRLGLRLSEIALSPTQLTPIDVQPPVTLTPPSQSCPEGPCQTLALTLPVAVTRLPTRRRAEGGWALMTRWQWACSLLGPSGVSALEPRARSRTVHSCPLQHLTSLCGVPQASPCRGSKFKY